MQKSLLKYQNNSYSADEEHGFSNPVEQKPSKSFLPPLKNSLSQRNLADTRKNGEIFLFQPQKKEKTNTLEKNKDALASHKSLQIKGSYFAKDIFTPKTKQLSSPKFASYEQVHASSFSHNREPLQQSTEKLINLNEDDQFEPLRAQKSNRVAESSNAETPRQQQTENKAEDDIFRLTLNKNSLPKLKQPSLRQDELSEFNSFTKMDRMKNPQNIALQQSYKALYRDIIYSCTNPEPYAFSETKAKEIQQCVTKLNRSINKKRNKKVFTINATSDNEHEDTSRNTSTQENISLKMNFMINEINDTQRNQPSVKLDKSPRKNLVNVDAGEDYGYDPRAQEAAFERYYKKVEPAKLKRKNQEYLAKLHKINKIKAQIKQLQLKSDPNLKSLEEIKQKNSENLKKYQENQISVIRSIVNSAKDQVLAKDHEMEEMIQNFMDHFSF